MSTTAIQSPEFTAAYTALNTEQRQAVDAIDGPVMVIAGPGTGKTQILTLRIALILLKTDTAPESILALTFTDAGAKNMRERLQRYIGRTAYRVPVYTFHSFAQHIITEYPDSFSRVIGGRPASELQKITLLETILSDPEVRTLRPLSHPSYYIKPLLNQISELKKENITPDDVAKMLVEQEAALADIPQYHEKGAHKGKQRGTYTDALKSLTKNQALAHVYRRYEALLTADRLFDYEDMIMETVSVLERDAAVLLDLQERYQYLLADEHQDVNGAQNRILELLASYHSQPNIFVVGDEKQAIYRFQGASLENFLHFTDVFADTKLIKLTENYRSGQTVLDASHSLIAVTEDSPLANLRVPLNAALIPNATVTMQTFSHEVIEEAWLTTAVQEALERGVPAHEIAIILRSNKEVEQFTHALRTANIPTYASADGDILDHALTHTVRALLSAVVEPTSDQALFRVLHGAYWGLSLSDTLCLMQARSSRTTLYQLLEQAADGTLAGIDNPTSFQRARDVLETARAMVAVQSPTAVVAYLISASGLLAYTATHNPVDGMRVIRRLYDEFDTLVAADPNTTLADVLRYFETTIAYRLTISAPYIKLQSESVQVMTAHKAKGLEFSVVFIPHMTDNRWNGKAKRQNFKLALTSSRLAEAFDPLDDERRLFYVALTRAKQEVYMSHSHQNGDGKDLLVAELALAIDTNCVEIKNRDSFMQDFDIATTMRSGPLYLTEPIAFIHEALVTRGFSATSFNNYVQNPWDYFYRNVLRIPEVKPLHMHFGTAVHAVLEMLITRDVEVGVEPPFSDVTAALTRALTNAPLSTTEYEQLYEQGAEVLAAYMPTFVAGMTATMRTEYPVRVVLETGLKDLPELPLSGTFDRIDYHPDGSIARIVDYKTGQPKSRNEIEGKTKHSDGRYKRQLVFYALLLSLYDASLYTEDIIYTLSFVQPATNGAIKEESFTVTRAEVNQLREQVIQAAADLLTGTFMKDQAMQSESEYSDFVTELLRRMEETTS